MSFAFRSIGALLLALCSLAQARELRVCADPDNLPMSHADESGFENRIARVIADEMGATLRYDWLQQVRGYVRKTLGEGLCDLFIGVPADFERVLPTRPYYRSTYVFVDAPRARGLEAFDDPRIARLRIGVQLVGNDLAATPPGHALAKAGLVDNVRGFTLVGEGSAAQRIGEALARGEIDAALVWGPQGGWLAARSPTPLEVHRASRPALLGKIPFDFDIAMGVRRGDTALRDELDAILVKRRADIDAILAAYSVPRTDVP